MANQNRLMFRAKWRSAGYRSRCRMESCPGIECFHNNEARVHVEVGVCKDKMQHAGATREERGLDPPRSKKGEEAKVVPVLQ